MVMSEEEKKLTAHHEAGHAIVGRPGAGARPGIQGQHHPRGRALGVTMFLPEGDRYSFSKQRLEARFPACSVGGSPRPSFSSGISSPPARRTTSNAPPTSPAIW